MSEAMGEAQAKTAVGENGQSAPQVARTSGRPARLSPINQRRLEI